MYSITEFENFLWNGLDGTDLPFQLRWTHHCWEEWYVNMVSERCVPFSCCFTCILIILVMLRACVSIPQLGKKGTIAMTRADRDSGVSVCIQIWLFLSNTRTLSSPCMRGHALFFFHLLFYLDVKESYQLKLLVVLCRIYRN